MRTALVLALLVPFCTPATAQPSAPAPVQPQIVVTGRAVVTVPPDAATLVLSVRTQAATAAGTAAENARRMDAVLAALAAMGVPAGAVTTSRYTVRPNVVYDRQRERQDGYVAENSLRVETGELERVGAIIDAALAAGANRVVSIDFSSSRLPQARRSALAEAISQAREDAGAMAQAAGGRLGSLVELSTERFDPAPGVVLSGRLAGLAVGETSIAPADIVVTATVLTRWHLDGP